MSAYNSQSELTKSIYTGMIDREFASLESYRPRLLINDHQAGRKVLSNVLQELRQCDGFFLSVAFITYSGVLVLLNELEALEKCGVRGKIIASQYLNFTQPKALERLLAFSNIELRMVTDDDLHAKGYIFRKGNEYSMIVGSSNLTQGALTSNKEWNVKLSSTDKGSLITETLAEFEQLYQSAVPVNETWIETYKSIYQSASKRRFSQGSDEGVRLAADGSGDGYHNDLRMMTQVSPNKMQVAALAGIEKLRHRGEKKALLVSATGTGKTYLAAFDIAKVNPRKVLFLAHREQLLDQAMESFQRVLGYDIHVGKVAAGKKEWQADYIFSTVQTMSKPDVLSRLDSNHFEYIIVDETHRIGADSYQKVLGHFEPEFLLGMTATPNRTDQYNICEDFDYNIAYEIRLQQAMEEKMLCPFHYFGITDMTVDGLALGDKSEFRHLVANERIEHIIERIRFYGHEGDAVKGLIFCSRNDEAVELSRAFNDRGYKTVAISGSDSMDKRQEAIERLENVERDDHLDYIITVDIFNEGVDIPTVNQIIMLRPTQSAIIFVQQLGRGLRLVPGKEFVVVLDFIGNYKNNFMIPMALSDDRSYNKDTIRRFAVEGSKVIPGCSTIHFDEIAVKKIYEAIDQVNFQSIKYMKENYNNLKYRLGRIPQLMDFEIHDSMDLAVLFNSQTKSYHEFLKKYEDAYTIEFNPIQEEMITFISKKLAIGKRPHELLLLRLLLQGSQHPWQDFEQILGEVYHIELKDSTRTNVMNILTAKFITGVEKKSYEHCMFIEDKKGRLAISSLFAQELEDEVFEGVIKELIDFGLFRYQKYYSNNYKKTSFQLYQKYSYEDVCRLLEWEKQINGNSIGGYWYDALTNTFPVFINYHKDESISETIKYEDEFLSNSMIKAISKGNRNLQSKDVLRIYDEQLGTQKELFVRKDKKDKGSKEFYYLGRIEPIGEPKEASNRGKGIKEVEFRYKLDVPVREDLYEYMTSI